MMRNAAVLAVLILALNASAQRLDETIEVSLVNVDVHVTDKQGNRVTGLTAADFEVREDGKLQAITNFSEYASGGGHPQETAAAASPAATAIPRPRRSVVLFIEPVTLPAFRTKELFDAIRKLLHQTVSKGDQVSLVTFTRGMQVREPFTDDLTVIDSALAKLEREMSGAEGTVFEESRDMLAIASEAEREFEAELAGRGMGTPMVSSGVALPALGAARRQRFLIKQKALALESLMQSISGADGKKIVLMATRRFGLYAGAEYLNGSVPPSHQHELDTAEYRKSLIRTANANGVTIYPIHAEGLGGSVDANPGNLQQILVNETAALNEVAEATGGVMASGSVEIAKTLPRVAEDLESYYSIGYRTPATRRDGARSIVVKTKNPDYVVRARRQFVEKSEETAMKDRVVANLFQKLGGSSMPIPFDVVLGKITKDGRNRWTVPLKVKVPIKALTLLPRGSDQTGEFSVYVATGGAVGLMSEVDRKSQTFTIPRSDIERAQGSHFTYEFSLTVDQVASRLSVAVMDEIGKEYNLKRYTLPKR